MRSQTLLVSLFFAACRGQEAQVEKRQTASGTTSSVFAAPTVQIAPNINSTDYDISQHFCRIYRHASVYADGKIYIDGGNTYVPRNSGNFNTTAASQWVKGLNNHLLVLDLSQSFTNQESRPYSTIFKGPSVPNGLIEHALWYSAATRKIYQLGGWFSFNNVNDPGFKNLSAIPEASIWQFDVDGKTWSEATGLALVDTGTKVQRPGAAAYCNAPTLNRSFIFEGYVQQRSDKEYINFTQSADFKFLEGMLQLDTSTGVTRPTLTNISVPQQMGGKEFGPRMNGAMVHVPVGKLGVVVALGGQMTINPTPYGVRIPKANEGNTNIPLTFVDIYDIESGFWFRQQTFGLSDGIPSGRSDICTVMIPAKDNSSFNIYMVAGVETYASYLTTEEIWVLSLPTFTWSLLHSRQDGIYGHTCHAVGDNLLVIGGMKTKDGGGDVNTCSDHMPAEIFSLKTGNYTGIFDVEGVNRTAPVPKKVVEAVGGTTEGGAVIKSPQLWSDLYLQYVFNPSIPRPAYTPTYTLANATNATASSESPAQQDNGPSGPNKSVTIGAAVGATVGFLILLVIALLLLWMRKKKKKTGAPIDNRQSTAAVSQTSELPAYTAEVKYYDPMSNYSPMALPQIQGPPVELGGADEYQYRSSIVPSSASPYSVPSETGSPPLRGAPSFAGTEPTASHYDGSQRGGQISPPLPPTPGPPPSGYGSPGAHYRNISAESQPDDRRQGALYSDRITNVYNQPPPVERYG
ncbi:hypothetical protein B0H63DRAFT_483993 [Podospora didyma]|uniref:Cell wall anchored protein n=1 Tax=Podospora didyma TaxID=330526 RepID=A0AAE0K8T3_9PEZI|nr:hypothetical protein B0H63DRAFT_483993 [Podospora didyma]